MKKQILTLGKTIQRKELKLIFGGNSPGCAATKAECEGPYGFFCSDGECVQQDPPPFGSGCWVCDHRYSL